MKNVDYERLVEKYVNDIYRVAVNSCKNRYDAEDIVQETFMKLMNSNIEFSDDEHAKYWLIRVTVNQCHNFWNTAWKRKVSSVEEQYVEPSFSMQENSELFYAVQELPVKYREVVHLYYYEEMKVKEIATILHIKESAVQTRLARARGKLKEALKEAWL